MDKRTRLEKTFAGDALDRPPVALWRHWPGDDQRAADLAHATVQDARTFDWDFAVLCPESHFMVTDHGLVTAWEGAPSGDRTPQARPVARSLAWTELRTLDPLRGALGKVGEALRLAADALADDETPLLLALVSPLTQAAQLAGQERLLRDIRVHPERVRSGLNTLTDGTLRFIDAVRRAPIAGVLYISDHADVGVMAEAEYAAFGLPYDRKVLDILPERWWFRMMHATGPAPILSLLSDLPFQALCWDWVRGHTPLPVGKSHLRGAACGGLHPWAHLHDGTPADVRAAARDAMVSASGRRIILAASGPVPVAASLSGRRAVRAAVNVAGVR